MIARVQRTCEIFEIFQKFQKSQLIFGIYHLVKIHSARKISKEMIRHKGRCYNR